MKKKIFFLIIFIISFYSFFFQKNKGSIKINQNTIDTLNLNTKERLTVDSTVFENVKYKFYDNNKEFITTGKAAEISKKNSNVINIYNVYSFTKLKDNSLLEIRSNKAVFFKKEKDIFYEDNVVISNAKGVIKTDTAKYFSKKRIIELYENIKIFDEKTQIIGDIGIYDIQKNIYELSMIDKEKKVYGKRKK